MCSSLTTQQAHAEIKDGTFALLGKVKTFAYRALERVIRDASLLDQFD